MHSTNYRNTLITVATDCPVSQASPPVKPESIAGLQFTRLTAAPYTLNSDELLLAVENQRKGPVSADVFFARPQACLRASPLAKMHGYGLHHDEEGRVALIPMESEGYARLMADPAVDKRPAMRRRRA